MSKTFTQHCTKINWYNYLFFENFPQIVMQKKYVAYTYENSV